MPMARSANSLRRVPFTTGCWAWRPQVTYCVPNVTARFASVRAGACGAGDCYLQFPEVEVYAVEVTASPEPASMALLATELLGVAAAVRRKRGKTQRAA